MKVVLLWLVTMPMTRWWACAAAGGGESRDLRQLYSEDNQCCKITWDNQTQNYIPHKAVQMYSCNLVYSPHAMYSTTEAAVYQTIIIMYRGPLLTSLSEKVIFART